MLRGHFQFELAVLCAMLCITPANAASGAILNIQKWHLAEHLDTEEGVYARNQLIRDPHRFGHADKSQLARLDQWTQELTAQEVAIIRDGSADATFVGYQEKTYLDLTNSIQSIASTVTGLIGGLDGYTGSQSAIADSFKNLHALGFWFPAPFYALFEYYMTVVQWVGFQLIWFRLHPVFLKFEYQVTHFESSIWGEVLQHYEGKQISSKEQKDTPGKWKETANRVVEGLLAKRRDFSAQKATYTGDTRANGGAVLDPQRRTLYQDSKRVSGTGLEEFNAVQKQIEEAEQTERLAEQMSTPQNQSSFFEQQEQQMGPTAARKKALLNAHLDVASDDHRLLNGIFLQQPSQQPSQHAASLAATNTTFPARVVALMSSLSSEPFPTLTFDQARMESLTGLRGALNGLAGIVTTFGGLGGYCGSISGLHQQLPELVDGLYSLIKHTWNDFPTEADIKTLAEMRYASAMFYTHALKFIGNKYTGFLQLSYLSTYFSQYLTTATLWVSTHNFFANYGQVTPHVPTFLKDQGYWTRGPFTLWGDLGPLVPKLSAK